MGVRYARGVRSDNMGMTSFIRENIFPIVVIGVLILLFSPFILIPMSRLIGVPMTLSEGERTGVIYKISKCGYFWKTWEGEMNLGGMSAMSAGKGGSVNIWSFSVVDPELVRRLITVT